VGGDELVLEAQVSVLIWLSWLGCPEVMCFCILSG